MNPQPFKNTPQTILKGQNHTINIFENQSSSNNIDQGVVDSFGEEWKKFHDFDKKEIEQLGKMYFDIVNEKMVNKNTYAIDIGCGTGRWSKYLYPPVLIFGTPYKFFIPDL